MRSRPLATVAAALLAAATVRLALAASGSPIVHPKIPYEESVEVVRRLVAVRLEPKRLAARGACVTLSAADLAPRIGDRPAQVANIERMPRPEVIWLLLDTSRSAEIVRNVVKRDAKQVLRELAQVYGAEVALVTIDEDTRLIAAPSHDYDRLAAAIDDIPPGGQSFLRDGLSEILGQIAGDRREHLVIFWTDGADRISVRTPTDVEAALAAAPNARLVPIVFPAMGGNAGQRLLDGLYFRLARLSGGEVYQCGGDWVERLRTNLSRRWLVTLVPSPGVATAAAIDVRSANRQCHVSAAAIADDPGVPPGPSPAWEDAWRHQRRSVDVEPCRPAAATDKPWRLSPQGEPGRIDGCALDIVHEQGILYRERAWGRAEVLSSLKLASRPWTLTVPAIEELAPSPEEALDRWVRQSAQAKQFAPDDGETSRSIVHGRTLLALQATLARSMWDTQPALRSFAEQRLTAEAERGIALAAAAIRIGDPALSREQATAVARASAEGRRLLAAVATPSDGDLRRTLAAWLGDLGARELFERWEGLLAAQWLAQQISIADAEALWATARAQFALPHHARTLALLVPGRDGAEGPAGFWRIVLPRAAWIFGRLTDDAEDIPYDHVPERPLGLLALERALSTDPTVDREAPRSVAVAYEPTVEPWREDPARPFRRGIVRLSLKRPGDSNTTTIEGAFESRRNARPEIVRVNVR